MSAIASIGLTLAFLAPLPPERPERPVPATGHAWAAALIIGSVCVMMVVPMITIWGFHRPEGGFRARCASLGGQVRAAGLDGSGPLRCDQAGLSETAGTPAAGSPARLRAP